MFQLQSKKVLSSLRLKALIKKTKKYYQNRNIQCITKGKSFEMNIMNPFKTCTSQIQDLSVTISPNEQENKERPMNHWFLAMCFWGLTCLSATELFFVSNFGSFYTHFKCPSFPDSSYQHRFWIKPVMLALTKV